MQKITPFLWFNGNAEEAMNFYTAIFPNARTKGVQRAPKGAPGPEGSVMVATMELEGQEFILLNGGPMFQFTEAISFVVNCETQEEVDKYWNALTAGGGNESRCGWLKDKFGLSWQIVPKQLTELMGKGSPAQQQAVMGAMMQMDKLIIADLEAAFEAAS